MKKWRKCMGIEPTGPMISIRPYGFEDREEHQLAKHFHVEKSGVKSNRAVNLRFSYPCCTLSFYPHSGIKG